jgi:hypothetical protein
MSDAVFCAPEEGWWHLHYNSDSHFVDIVTPGGWRTTAMDLDSTLPATTTGPSIRTRQFAIHRVKFGYIQSGEQEDRSIVTASDPPGALLRVAAAWLARLPRRCSDHAELSR